jgi:hypothetical protein
VPPPVEEEAMEARGYIKAQFETWEAMEMKYGLKSGIGDSERMFKGFEYFLLYQFDFDRQSRFRWLQGGWRRPGLSWILWVRNV